MDPDPTPDPQHCFIQCTMAWGLFLTFWWSPNAHNWAEHNFKVKFLFSTSVGMLCDTLPILKIYENLQAQFQWLFDGDIQVKFSVPVPYLIDPMF